MQQLHKGSFLHEETYKIIDILGQGSFGITYLAEHIGLGRKFAIKEFFMKDLNSRNDDGSVTGMTDGGLAQGYCAKFQKEAINLSQLDNPNIVRVTDFFSENGTFYYVMDYIEGQNLNDYINQHHISEQEAIAIITSVANALIYMHEEKHILHLDLKPGNIMRRDCDGHIFVIDFGLSKHFSDDGQPDTSTTIGQGTIGYAPIEQGSKVKNGVFRPTIDVYALGATLYKLLTYETPPQASDLVSDDAILETNLHAKGVSDNLIKVITESMCPNVRKRIQNVRTFVSMLNGVKSDVVSNGIKGKEERTHDNSQDENTILSEPKNDEDWRPIESDQGENYDSLSQAEDRHKNIILVFIVVALVFISFLLFRGCDAQNTTVLSAVNVDTTDTCAVDTTDIMTANYYDVSSDEETNIKNNADEFRKKLSASSCLGMNTEGTKVYYVTGTTNNYKFHVYDADKETIKEISYEELNGDFYLYVYDIEAVKNVGNHIYIISSTGASGSGDQNSIFYINTLDDKIYFFDSGDEACFVSNNKVSVRKKIVTNYSTAECSADYTYEFMTEIKKLR